jgi:hypothetical protein
MSKNNKIILTTITLLESRLQEIDIERGNIVNEINKLKKTLTTIVDSQPKQPTQLPSLTAQPLSNEKIVLFRSLFRGREDVFPRYWVSKKTKKTGYSPVCENEWIRGICNKGTIKCGECENRKFSPLTNEITRKHLDGEVTIGVYPLMKDETCWFLAVDFDGQSWQDDVLAFLSMCKKNNVPAALERSRSGNGGHVWIFFSEPVSAALARQMGSYLITLTMSHRHELDMKSYDRIFPNQDTLPKGGFGSLIALPLQKDPMNKGNSVFINEKFVPYTDQWDYLSKNKKLSLNEVQIIVTDAERTRNVMGAFLSEADEEIRPWEKHTSNRKSFQKLACKLPSEIHMVIANRIYINKSGLPSQLINQIKRLAAFQNPEFYKKQRMRLSTALTPRIISCSEDIQSYITIPRGCLEDLEKLLTLNNIAFNLKDKRFNGNDINYNFYGKLTEEQEKACNKLLKQEFGVFVAPPGVGKTVLGINLLVSRKVNTLILVHRKPLLEQWRTQIASFLQLPIKEIGQIGGGRDKSTNIIDVAMIQRLDKKEGVDKRIKNYGHIIIDECHHVSAFSFEKVMMEANAKYITGLTATPYRRDGHDPIISMQCGPIRYRIIRNKHVDSKPLRHKLIKKITAFSCSFNNEDKIHTLWPQLIANEERNQMIFNDILKALEEKQSPIVLTERKEHLEILKQKLESFVKNIIILHGGMRAKTRKEMMAMLTNIHDSEERLILATGQYIGEGFDDPRLDTLFLAMPFSFSGKMIQYAGRLHRLHPGKAETKIYDYVDENIPVLSKMYRRRLKAYRALGYEESISK